MFHRVWAVSAAFTLILLSVVSASPAEASSAGVTVASGTIAGANGASMSGVTVDLYAWPSDATLKAMKSGATVPTTLLATATTSSTGKYVLEVPATTLEGVAVESGYANLEVYSPAGIWFLSYQTGALPGHSSAPATIDLSAKKNGWACGNYRKDRPYSFTGFAFQRPRANAWAVVGQGYIVRQKKTAGDWFDFKYTQGSSHTQASSLGVGISGYGFDAGYNDAGSHASTASRAETYPSDFRNSWLRTEFETGQFRGMCYGPHSWSYPHLKQKGQCPKKTGEDVVRKCIWMIQSIGWYGGATTHHPSKAPRTPSKDCAKQQAGSGFDADYGTAIQWSHGFDLGAALGIKGVTLKGSFNSSTQTGYDSNAFMHFKFHHAGFLCGTNGPISTAAMLVQRADKP